jgi:mRNA interferase MazF
MDIELSKVNKHLDWLKTELYLDVKAANAPNKIIRFVKRGQVYQCNFGVGVGSEQEKNYRPCVILQNYEGNRNSPNTIVAPITHSDSNLKVVVPIATQYKSDSSILLDGHVLLGNIVTISKARLGDYITDIPSSEIKKIDEAIAISVDIYKYYKDLELKLNDKIEYISKLKVQRNHAQDELKELLELLDCKSFNKAKEKLNKNHKNS